jgi:hypothetical protein
MADLLAPLYSTPAHDHACGAEAERDKLRATFFPEPLGNEERSFASGLT